ncbi:MAG TPA: helix-turn-helix transcriptional regulator [Nannocystaceae bacterium]|nr:helix-turn-helix transcriptional regulator [Nannocystaceae bacterium]
MSVGSPRGSAEERYMIELGRRIRIYRERARLTQQSLARLAGIATDIISRLENGHYTSPGLRTLLRIGEGLGVSVSELLPEVALAEEHPQENARTRLLSLLDEVGVDEADYIVEVVAAMVRNRDLLR